MSEFARLLLFAAGIVAIILIGIPLITLAKTGSFTAALATFVFLVVCCIWGWVAGGIDHRNGKE